MQPITIRFPDAVYETLRRRSFDTRESMNTLVVQAVHFAASCDQDRLRKWLEANPVREDK